MDSGMEVEVRETIVEWLETNFTGGDESTWYFVGNYASVVQNRSGKRETRFRRRGSLGEHMFDARPKRVVPTRIR